MSSPTNPYAEAHEAVSGAGDSRPTAIQIIKDEGLENQLGDKTILITGASSGIGIETARALHFTGAHILMQVRDMSKGEKVLKDILATSPGTGKLELVRMNLDSLQSVREGVAEVLKMTDRLNVLVNNAGVRNTPESKTVDGFETQFAVNHLSHFLLTHLLTPLLLKSSTPTFSSRVINVSSAAHWKAPFNYSNPNLTGIYNPRFAYAHSKTANILMANHLNRLYGHPSPPQTAKIHGISLHPGCIFTNLQKEDYPTEEAAKVRLDSDPDLKKVLKTVEQGAATTVWAAVGKVWEGKGAVYLEDCRLGVEVEQPHLVTGGYKNFVFDKEGEERLWEMSLEMVGCS